MRLRFQGTSTLVLATLLVIAAGMAVFNGGNTTSVAAAAADPLKFEGVWARAASAGHMSAAYMTIENTGVEPVDIVAAYADVADKVEVHKTTTEITFEDGKVAQVMRMEEIDSLPVAPGVTVELKPGGLHVMLIGLTRDIEEGDTFPLTLELATGARVVIDVPVTVGTGDDDHDHNDH